MEPHFGTHMSLRGAVAVETTAPLRLTHWRMMNVIVD